MQYLDVFLSVVVSFFCGNRGAPFQELSRRKIPFSIKTGFSVLIDRSQIGYVNRRKIPLVGPWPSTQVPNAEMNNLITVKNVRAYLDENGMAQINLEDAARGLGFTRDKNGTEYIIWDRVLGYLAEFGFHTCVERPEFQAMVADEILPSIRKTGGFRAPTTMTQAQLIAGILYISVE